MRTLFLFALATVVIAASGCASNTPVVSNKATYDCSGLGKGWGDCTEKADAACGAHNYTVVSRSGEPEEKGAGGNTEMKRTMVVQCNR